ncbi:hypothetical protein [Ruegeria arenilitoris]|uniref:hypothetical protein n=1 Tax=Ruegeria arenilitoris TaxID=1173585 RepID=UPI00147BF0A2|nr:hypothetical protein [Ruegeria arenilitoris]
MNRIGGQTKDLMSSNRMGALGHGDHCRIAAVARVEQARGHVFQRIVVLHINLSIAPFGGRFALLFVGGTVEGLLVLVAQQIDDFDDVELGFGQVFTGQPVALARRAPQCKRLPRRQVLGGLPERIRGFYAVGGVMKFFFVCLLPTQGSKG